MITAISVIYVRDTTDWLQGRMTKFNESSHVCNKIYEWNQIFSMSYWEYRHAIKEISVSNWEDTGSRLHIMELEKLEIDADQYVVPTDDDDWLCPEEMELDIDADIVVWDSIVYKTAISRSYRIWSCKALPCTNNYAVRGSFLNKLKPEDRYAILNHHMSVFRVKKKYKGRLKCLRKTYSCYNWHPGSASAAKFIPQLHKSIPSCSPHNEKVVHSNPWVKPYVQRFNEVLEQVKLTGAFKLL
jgi:hypothetical protein